jgi:nucleoside-specific outer membrane channel protein Tsx
MLNNNRKLATTIVVLLLSSIAQSAFAAKKAPPPPARANQQAAPATTQASASEDAPAPPERANQEASFSPFSTWDIQALDGSSFREPGVSNVVKKTFTLENSAAWSWGSSYFFLDYMRSNSSDQNATEFYGEWYPSASVSRITCRDFSARPILNDILLTMGFNAGTKSTGASPLAFLPGITWDLKIPYFQFFSVGTYAYMDRGRVNGQGNGCNSNTYQITPSWSLPFAIRSASFRFDGFVDYIGKHGQCAHQIVSQPTIKLDLGNFNSKPNRLFAGVEWSYWRNKYGISGLNQTAPQAVVMWVF